MTAATDGWHRVFRRALPEVALRAARRPLARLAAELATLGPPGDGPSLVEVCRRHLEGLAAVETRARGSREALGSAGRMSREREVLLALLAEHSGRGTRAADRRALSRWLDAEALDDRLVREVHAARQSVELACSVLAFVGPGQVGEVPLAAARQAALDLASRRDVAWTVRVAAVRAVAACCTGASDGPSRQALAALAAEDQADPWVQAAAVQAWSALTPDDGAVLAVLHARMRSDPDGSRHADHLFLRARVVRLAARRGLWDVPLAVLRGDEASEHVRLAAVQALASSPAPEHHTALADILRGSDDVVIQAGGAIAALAPAAPLGAMVAAVATVLDGGEAATRVVLRALAERLHPDRWPSRVAEVCREAWGAALSRWSHSEQAHPDVATDAAAVHLALDLASSPVTARVWRQVQRFAAGSSEGATTLIRTDLDPERLLDVLALVAQASHDLCAAPAGQGRWRLRLGARPTTAPWRIVHEVLRPRPDKRQAWNHIHDYLPAGTLFAPSGTVVEVTPTMVPGRAIASPTRRWWGPELPLPAWLLAASRRGRLEVRALPHVRYTLAAGTVRPVSWLRAQSRYVRLARTRNQLLDGPAATREARYDVEVRKSGVRVERRAIGPMGGLGGLLAVDGSTLEQLAVYTAAVGLTWLSMALIRQARVRRDRGRLPLVIGGWGSRGKSGTERLKAGLFHELGYSVLSKTTGNEAMVVVGLPGREPVEIFLYRPYDRASIVEQREVLGLAARLDVQVLLWECMALNPRYVEILQRDWMRDDLTTITNTYPDHEDVHGPSGREVAATIARVMPRRGVVVSTEQAMTPVLTDRARALHTELDSVPAEAWELVPADVLARFPYSEHPRNIALVATLGERLGVPRDVALRAMADRVVPDLGVLKEYGPIAVGSRTASFVVGNSANERAGFLSNWERMGFTELPDRAGLDDSAVLVVNNRKDRLPRQEVFARVAALDAPVDLLAVIGTNVMAFGESWRAALRAELRPRWLSQSDDRAALAGRIARRLRRPLLDRARAIEVFTAGVAAESTQARRVEVVAAWEEAGPDRLPSLDLVPGPAAWLAECAWLHRLQADPEWDVEAVVDHALARIGARFLPFDDPGVSGDRISFDILARTPAVGRVRMLGAANIKGTGLDLVYRWVSIDRVGAALRTLAQGDPARSLEALTTLRALDLGRLDGAEAERGLGGLLASGALLNAHLRSAAEALHRDIRAQQARLERAPDRAGRSWWREALGTVRANWDFEAVPRRETAERLMKDLGAGRVGLGRAAKVAKGVVSRQKAG